MNVSAVPIAVAISALVAVTDAAFAQGLTASYREVTIGLSEVPQAAIDAAQKALGIAPTEARLIPGTSPQEYELEAPSKSGGGTSVHVLENGTVINREHEEKGND